MLEQIPKRLGSKQKKLWIATLLDEIDASTQIKELPYGAPQIVKEMKALVRGWGFEGKFARRRNK